MYAFFSENFARQEKNDCSGFWKRPQWFWKTTAVVFGNDRTRFAFAAAVFASVQKKCAQRIGSLRFFSLLCAHERSAQWINRL